MAISFQTSEDDNEAWNIINNILEIDDKLEENKLPLENPELSNLLRISEKLLNVMYTLKKRHKIIKQILANDVYFNFFLLGRVFEET